MAKSYWLMKSEPEVFSIHDMQSAPGQKTSWEGVRNYQARNFIRDQMQVRDRVLFYHSNAQPSGVAGIVEVASKAYPDVTAFDPNSPYFDEKSKAASPAWYVVDVAWVETFPAVLPLEELRAEPRLSGLELLRRGSRLSVQPLSKTHFEIILKMARRRAKLGDQDAPSVGKKPAKAIRSRAKAKGAQ